MKGVERLFEKSGAAFELFSVTHFLTLFIITTIILMFYLNRRHPKLQTRFVEKTFAISLLSVEWLYYFWMINAGIWDIRYSLPLELCSLSLYSSIILLWTGNRHFYPFVLFAGIGGAMQAILTPDLELTFPHFRFLHFFFVHTGIILTALYFTWIRNYRPTLKDVFVTMIQLNIVAFIIFIINLQLNSNYMFLSEKPKLGSLLDYLGPYPYYILSLEFVACGLFFIVWFIFKKRKSGNNPSY